MLSSNLRSSFLGYLLTFSPPRHQQGPQPLPAHPNSSVRLLMWIICKAYHGPVTIAKLA